MITVLKEKLGNLENSLFCDVLTDMLILDLSCYRDLISKILLVCLTVLLMPFMYLENKWQ